MWVIAGGVVLIALAALGAGGGRLLHTSRIGHVPLPGGARASATAATPHRPPTSQHPHAGITAHGTALFWIVFGALLLAVAITAAVLLGLASQLRWGRLRRPVLPEAHLRERAAARDELVADIDAARREALDESDPRAAVLLCWVRLEAAVARVGTERGATETSAELTRRVLAGYAVEPAALDRLLALYETARYSTAAVDAAAQDEARRLLDAVRGSLVALVPS